MDIQELSMQRFIMYFKEANTGVHPQKFCFVLGAGASKSSRIPTGEDLVKTWEKELAEAEGSEHEKWKQRLGITSENQAEFYSAYYGKRFLEPSDGYNYMEQQMDTATPSVGYTALAYLLCRKENNSNIVLTTNFDHLAEDAVSRQQKVLPLVVGHEALAHYVTHYIKEGVKRPIIVKIHRDLLMEPKSTPKETDKLHEKWIPPLDELFAHYHPVFIGYAGNDKSLMQFLLENLEKFQRGDWKLPYWTIYGSKPIYGMAKAFMEATGGYVIYGVDFDELMILLGDALDFKMQSADEAAEEARREHAAIIRKIDEVLTKKTLTEAARAAGEAPRAEKPDAAAADPAGGSEPDRLNEAIDRITGDTESPSARFRQAVTAFYKGDYAEAERLLRQLTAEEPDNAVYHINLGAALYWMGRYEEAEAEYRRALELEPDNAAYHNSLGATLNAMQRCAEAEAEARRAVDLAPDNAKYHDDLGTTLQWMGRYEEAEAETRRALELEPDNAKYHNSLGATLHAMKRYEEAEAALRRAVEFAPYDPKKHENLAKTLRALNREEEAAQAEAKAAALRAGQGR